MDPHRTDSPTGPGEPGAAQGREKLGILLITYCFPPMNSVASHRPYGWARAWRDLGHAVHVLTPVKRAFDGPMDLERDLSGIDVHEVPYLPGFTRKARREAVDAVASERWERLKSATRRLRFSLAMFGDPRLLAYRALLRAGQRIVAAHDIDLIVATSPPEVALFVARAVSRRCGIPWVADFRDLWFHETRLQHSRLASHLSGRVNRWLTRDAAALITVSAGLRDRLSRFLGREVLLSYNGYFEDTRQRPAQPADDGRLHIVYAGRVYPGRQDPEPLFRALAALRREGRAARREIVVDFYGHPNRWLHALTAKYALDDQVRFHGFVPYHESLAAQRAASVLLFLDWTDAEGEGVLTGKLFEYLGNERPILALGRRPATEAAALIAQTGAGVTLCSDEEVLDYVRRLAAGNPPRCDPTRPRHWLSREYQARAILTELRTRLPGMKRRAGARQEVM